MVYGRFYGVLGLPVFVVAIPVKSVCPSWSPSYTNERPCFPPPKMLVWSIYGSCFPPLARSLARWHPVSYTLALIYGPTLSPAIFNCISQSTLVCIAFSLPLSLSLSFSSPLSLSLFDLFVLVIVFRVRPFPQHIRQLFLYLSLAYARFFGSIYTLVIFVIFFFSFFPSFFSQDFRFYHIISYRITAEDIYNFVLRMALLTLLLAMGVLPEGREAGGESREDRKEGKGIQKLIVCMFFRFLSFLSFSFFLLLFVPFWLLRDGN